MSNTTYSYGHTAEASKLVRDLLKRELANEINKYDLTISVRKADSSYGGPRVNITTSKVELDKRYEYIVNSDGSGIGDGPGLLESKPVSDFTYGRPHHTARLVVPEALEQLNKKINSLLSEFGHDNDDAMTDYFDNTAPLFYGVAFNN